MDLDKIELIEEANHAAHLAGKNQGEAVEDERGADSELTTRFLKQRQDRLDRQVLKLARSLIQHGYKVTDPRLEIIEAITTFDNGFNLNELQERLIERSQNKATQPPGIASVFRTVKLMTEELSLLQRVHSGDGCHRYALQRGHQHQLVCRCCERTIEFEGCDFSELTRFLEEKTGFQLEGHWLEFFGLCQLCRQAQPAMFGTGENLKLLPHDHPQAPEDNPRPEPVDISQISQSPIGAKA